MSTTLHLLTTGSGAAPCDICGQDECRDYLEGDVPELADAPHDPDPLFRVRETVERDGVVYHAGTAMALQEAVSLGLAGAQDAADALPKRKPMHSRQNRARIAEEDR